MQDNDLTGSTEDKRERSSAPILTALNRTQRDFNSWQATCSNIDSIYSLGGLPYAGYGSVAPPEWQDTQLDLFWASFEVLKPAVYASVPVPAVSSMFKDNKPLNNTTAELLERSAISVFERANLDDAMHQVRDDLLLAGRGVLWVYYSTEGGEQNVCTDHVDRTDFCHEIARYWSEVGWVARRCWMDEKAVNDRFTLTQQQKDGIQYARKRGKGSDDNFGSKAAIWEVWHKADKKVYWVTEGVDTYLDVSEPEVTLKNFFPCPRPAYGTLKRRSLIPVPDWERYAVHFSKISELTARIYSLLDAVKMKGIVAGGGDVANAVEELLRSDDDQTVIRVNSMATDANSLVAWMPLVDVATAIQGLIDARTQLISDFYQLSGISDIMRGATEADETLGAQQLKSQYGSVRVQDKIKEMQRIAADATRIAAEIIAEKFTQKNLLEMAQMELPTSADIKKRIKEIEDAAKAETKALTDKAIEAIEQGQQAAAQDPNADPQALEQAKAQAQQQYQQAQQQIADKYGAMLAEAQQLVPIDDVMKLLRDDKARSFAFEIETDSTIMTDELQEKASRNEFLQVFSTASQSLLGLAGTGEQGAELAGALIKFVVAPYRAGRQLDDKINAWIDAAPQITAAAAGQEGDSEALAEANKMLAEAENKKADAAMANVQARSAQAEADNQRKMAELQVKMQNDAEKARQENDKLRLQLEKQVQEGAAKDALTQAQIDNLTAKTAQILNSIGLDVREQELDEYRAAEATQQARVDTAMQANQQATDNQFRERGEQRSDRGEQRADRQQEFGEQQAMNEGQR